MTQKISRHYQEAFRSLANALIFTNPVDITISRKNIRSISQKIQEQFIGLDTSHQEQLDKLFTLGGEPINRCILSDRYLQMDDVQFVEDFSKIFKYFQGISDDIGYSGWGCTPRLASGANGMTIARNCLGIITTLGAYFKKKGIAIEFGLGADHPFIFAHTDDGMYVTDGFCPRKMVVPLNDYGSYKLYRPSDEERTLHQMVFVFNFDDAVLYTVLESMEALRRMSLGEKGIHLPGGYESGMAIAEPHAELLQKINWKDLQAHLFPEMTAAFRSHCQEWSEEVSLIHTHRKKQDIAHLLAQGINLAMEELNHASPDESGLKKALHHVLLAASIHETEVSSFLREGKSFSGAVHPDVVGFFSILEQKLRKTGIFGAVTGRIEIMISQAGARAASMAELTNQESIVIL